MAILDDAQIEQLRKKETAKARDAQRKRDERAAAKAAKLKAKEDDELRKQGRVPHIPVKLWWEANRSKHLTPSQMAQLEERQSTVLDMFYWAQQVIDGAYNLTPDDPDYVSLQDGADLIRDDVARFGVTQYFYKTAMFISVWREDPTFSETVRQQGHPIFFGYNPTQISLLFGYLTALPAEISTNPKLPGPHRPLTCSQCGWTDPGAKQVTREFYCPDCMVKRDAATAAAWSRANAWVLERHMRSTPVRLDSYGRR